MDEYSAFYASLGVAPGPLADAAPQNAALHDAAPHDAAPHDAVSRPDTDAQEAAYHDALAAQPTWYLEGILCGWEPEDLDHHAATLGQGETVVLVLAEGIINRVQRSALSPIVYLIRHRSTRLCDTLAMRSAMARAGFSADYLP